MTRAIDCEIAKKRLQAWIDESEAQGFEEAARNFRDCISLLDAVPTLTPTNEALTLDELREMDGEPVWVEDVKHWALIDIEKGGQWAGIPFAVWAENGANFTYDIEGRNLRCYRRPPEGEV